MQKIISHLWYDKEAKEAAEFYVKVFNNNPFKAENPDFKESKINRITVFKDTPSGDCDFVEFELQGQQFMAISAGPSFKFTEAISFLIQCASQEEMDYFMDNLSASPESEVCGWCKDKYGLSWQIWTKELGDMLASGQPEKIAHMQAVLFKMGRLNIAELKKAFNS